MIKRILFGFLLSAPLSLAYYIGFTKNLSSAENSLWLGVMLLFLVLTLPGSIILLLVGFVAAFQGKVGEQIAAICMYLSIANAHAMGSLYYWLYELIKGKREKQ